MKEATKRTIKFRIKQILVFTIKNIYRAIIIITMYNLWQ